METVDLSWNEVISRRSNHPLLPKTIRGLIVGKSGCGKRTLLLNLLLRPGWLNLLLRPGWLNYGIFAYSEKAFFNPNIE